MKVGNALIFTKNWVGILFGWFSRKLIWSLLGTGQTVAVAVILHRHLRMNRRILLCWAGFLYNAPGFVPSFVPGYEFCTQVWNCFVHIYVSWICTYECMKFRGRVWNWVQYAKLYEKPNSAFVRPVFRFDPSPQIHPHT
jgi:hypothetical protein